MFLIPLLINNLVSSNDSPELILPQKVLTKLPSKVDGTSSTIVFNTDVITVSFFIPNWIRPNKITNLALKWYLLETVQFINFFDVIPNHSFRGYSPMNAEILIIYYACQRKKIKHVHYLEVQILRIFSNKLTEKVIHLSHLPGLVVASQHKYLFRKSNFQREEQYANLGSINTSVNIIS